MEADDFAQTKRQLDLKASRVTLGTGRMVWKHACVVELHARDGGAPAAQHLGGGL